LFTDELVEGGDQARRDIPGGSEAMKVVSELDEPIEAGQAGVEVGVDTLPSLRIQASGSEFPEK